MMNLSDKPGVIGKETEQTGRTDVVQRLLEVDDGNDNILPGLTSLAEQAIATWQADLSVAMGQDIQVQIYKISNDSAQFFARKVSPEGASALVSVGDWESPVIAGATRNLVFSCVNALFGGDGSEPQLETDRPLSKIELELMSHVFALLAESLQSSFKSIAEIQFSAQTVSGSLDVEETGLKNCAMIGITLSVAISGEHHQALLCFPKDALAMISGGIAGATTKPARQDPAWIEQLSHEVRHTPVEILARLDGGEVPLGKLAQMQVGDVVKLPAAAGNLVEVVCNDVPLLRCQIGQADGLFQLKVDHFISSNARLIDSLLSNSTLNIKHVS